MSLLNEIISTDSLLQLFCGKFTEEVFNKIREIVPSRKLTIFFSSTFTDTHAERNIIMEEILPELQLKGKIYGITVIFVDMRFGVKDENTKDHMTWIACAEQIRHCYKESDGMFFMSLQGDKYGYNPIPKFIKQSLIVDKIIKFDVKTRDLFSKWYLLDENNIPPKYTLKNLIDKDDNDFWNVALPTLREALEDIAYDLENSSDIVIGRSVTEWEALLAMKLSPERCSWLHRTFKSGIDVTFDQNRKVIDYCDFLNSQRTRNKYENLITVMNNQIPNQNITLVNGPSLTSYMQKDSSFEDYLKVFKKKMGSTLSNEFDKVVDKVTSWNKDGHGLGFSGEIIDEMVHHCRILEDKCKTFQGREDLLTESLNHIKRVGLKPNKCYGRFLKAISCSNSISPTTTSDLRTDIALSIIGISGSGKTALTSKLAETCKVIFPSTPIIVRFCGTSKGSVNGLVLVTSICQQIQLVYNLERKEIPPRIDKAVKYFHDLMLRYPVILFIDSLDQLTDDYFARSKLSFLFRIKVHENSRIIVSTLPDDKDEVTKQWGKYVYLCDTRLLELKIPRVVVKPLHAGSNESKSILSGILSLSNRKLTNIQTQSVLSSLSSEPTALYLNLAVNIVCHWRSYDLKANNQILQDYVPGLINQIFDRLELDFGRVLTRYAVGFITFSRAGVNDKMMQDLLSLIDDVKDEVFQYSKPAKYDRIPLHVWLRLCSSMKGLLVIRSFNCWNWYHRQLTETVVKRYSEDEICVVHETIGRYMSNIVPADIMNKRLINAQPLTFTPVSIWFDKAVINEQRFIEGFYHLVHGDLLEEAANELTRFDVICGCILAGQGFKIIESLQLLQSKVKQKKLPGDLSKRVDHFVRWLCQDMTFLLINTRSAITFSATSQPKASLVRESILKLLEETENKIGNHSMFGKDEWIRVRTLGGFDNFTPCLTTMVGHTGEVTSVRISNDGSRIISGSSDKTVKVWDVLSGKCVNTFRGHKDPVTSVCISNDGSIIVSGSYDRMIKIWDAVSGECVNTLKGHDDWVTSVCISNNASRIVSGSNDNTVKVWDATIGKCLNTLKDHGSSVTSVCISKDGSKIVSGSRDSTIKVWDAVSGKCVNTLSGHNHIVFSVFISNDGLRIISGSYERTVKIWDAVSGECVNTFRGHNDLVTSVCITNDGSRIVSASDDKNLKVWDLVSEECVNTFEGHNRIVKSVCISYDGNRIVSGSEDNTVKIWDAVSGKCLNTFEGHTSSVTSVCISKDGSKIISGSNDITVWDVVSGKCIITFEGHKGYISSICISNDGSRIVSDSGNNTVKIWDAVSGECVNTFEGHTGEVTSVCISNDGCRIISGSYDETLKVWDVLSGKCLNTFEGHQDPVYSVCISNDGSRIVSGSEDETVKIWDVVSGKCVNTFEGHTSWVMSVCISNDGSRIVSGSWDSTVKVWDVVSGKCVNTLEGHTSWVMSVCISDNGNKIVSGSNDTTVQVWDAVSRIK